MCGHRVFVEGSGSLLGFQARGAVNKLQLYVAQHEALGRGILETSTNWLLSRPR